MKLTYRWSNYSSQDRVLGKAARVLIVPLQQHRRYPAHVLLGSVSKISLIAMASAQHARLMCTPVHLTGDSTDDR